MTRNLRSVGRGVSAGTAIGRAVVAVRDAGQVRYRLAASGVDRERQRLKAARAETRHQLEEISSRVSRTVGQAQAAIFAAQLLMLDDPMFTARVDALIRTERINADWALDRALGELRDVFTREGDAWLRERAGDLADVGGRLLRNLRPGRDPLVDFVRELEGPLIVVADELSPSIAAQLDWTKVRGLVCDVGSPTHHTVILMRSLGIPAVVGLGSATQIISPGQTVAVDGATGEIMCLVEVPAEFKTVERQVLVAPASTRTVEVPAEYKEVEKTVLVSGPTTRKVVIPAEYDTVTVTRVKVAEQKRVTPIPATYKTITRTVVTQPSRQGWQRILCDTNMDLKMMVDLQLRLTAKGYDAGPAIGRLTDKTREALTAFQQANGLATGGITYETLAALGMIAP